MFQDFFEFLPSPVTSGCYMIPAGYRMLQDLSRFLPSPVSSGCYRIPADYRMLQDLSGFLEVRILQDSCYFRMLQDFQDATGFCRTFFLRVFNQDNFRFVLQFADTCLPLLTFVCPYLRSFAPTDVHLPLLALVTSY